MNILYGTVVAQKLQEELKERLSGKNLTLAVIVVGEDYGSAAYLRQIAKYCQLFSVRLEEFNFPEDITEEELLAKIDKLNKDEEITAIMLQRPLPATLDNMKISVAIAVEKDIDGTHPENLGRLVSGQPLIVPATAKAVMELLAYYDIDPAQKEVTIVGRSLSVGKPLSALMTNAQATVTLCHSKTKDLPSVTKKADIMVAAIGKAEFFGAEHFTENSIVIDVGINTKEGKLCGDVDYEAVADKVAAITPVPKGVGSLTTMIIFTNLAEISERK